MSLGYIAYDAAGQPFGMGPTTQAAIADARQRGCESGRLRRATLERVAEASRLLPPPRPVETMPPPAPPATGYNPTRAYFDAVCRGDYKAAKRLLTERDEACRCRT